MSIFPTIAAIPTVYEYVPDDSNNCSQGILVEYLLNTFISNVN